MEWVVAAVVVLSLWLFIRGKGQRAARGANALSTVERLSFLLRNEFSKWSGRYGGSQGDDLPYPAYFATPLRQRGAVWILERVDVPPWVADAIAKHALLESLHLTLPSAVVRRVVERSRATPSSRVDPVEAWCEDAEFEFDELAKASRDLPKPSRGESVAKKKPKRRCDVCDEVSTDYVMEGDQRICSSCQAKA